MNVMTKKILIAIYFLGVIAGYCYGKNYFMRFNERLNSKYPNNPPTHWTVSDRNIVLLLSTCSWIDVVVFGLVDIINNTHGNAEANW